ncbi:YceD family protein [Alkalibacterium olivapovliticus]|uniref:Nucleic acid-binding protein n=1 Tax=Alkalibacterium olivapovliticus TaxID=99907 RepID=A0A2T0WBS5_9LACT|nr:YceD family protein [Alkalibacterium olivapovliticus]PRY83964.1 uncharacterized protein CLV38_102151 [Alkalibacterium olivapovliticus]
MKTKWALNELKKYQDHPLQLDGSVDFEQSLKNRDKEILSVESIQVKGSLANEKNEVFYVDLVLTALLTLPSSRSLEPVDVTLTIPFSEIYLPQDSPVSIESFTEGEIVEELTTDTLDLQKPIEDAILTNKPTQVYTEEERQSDTMPSGKDWDVLGEEQYHNQPHSGNDSEGDPRFAALKDLFKDKDE